uniref:Uncharacterized protein n=1 Tax=Anguilla anguilla TaxID=7936 RepID=A0A0E9RN70_ANGAN
MHSAAVSFHYIIGLLHNNQRCQIKYLLW